MGKNNKLIYLYQGKLSGLEEWLEELKVEWKKEKEENYEIN